MGEFKRHLQATFTRKRSHYQPWLALKCFSTESAIGQRHPRHPHWNRQLSKDNSFIYLAVQYPSWSKSSKLFTLFVSVRFTVIRLYQLLFVQLSQTEFFKGFSNCICYGETPLTISLMFWIDVGKRFDSILTAFCWVHKLLSQSEIQPPHVQFIDMWLHLVIRLADKLGFPFWRSNVKANINKPWKSSSAINNKGFFFLSYKIVNLSAH